MYVKGADAIKLMNIVNKQKVARARIQHRPPRVSLHPAGHGPHLPRCCLGLFSLWALGFGSCLLLIKC